MARFGQGLIQGLINPGYELNTTGMMAGGLAGRIAERKKEELQRQQQQAALMSAYKMGQSPGGSDPASAMAALTQAVPGIQAKDLMAMQQAGMQTAQAQQARAEELRVANGKRAIAQLLARNDASDPRIQQGVRKIALETGVPIDEVNSMIAVNAQGTGLAGRDRYVTAGANVFDMETSSWLTPPTQAEVNAMDPKDIAKLYEKNTPESVQGFIKDPQNVPLVPREQVEDIQEAKATPEQKVAKLLATDNTIEVINNTIQRFDNVFQGTYDVAKRVPLTQARALEADLNTVKANLAFDRLQKMRDESKTGGALGQVSNIELKLLESAVAGLDPAAPNFKANLERVRRSYDDFRRAVIGLPPASNKYKEIDGTLYYTKDDKWYELGAME